MLNGEPASADEWNRRLRVTVETAVCSSALGLTTTITDVAGCEVTVETEAANAVYIAYGVFDFEQIAAGTTTIAVGILDVDGTDDTRQAIFNGVADNNRATAAQVWTGVLASAGSHTFKLQGQRAGGADGVKRINNVHTSITVHVMEVA
jgi:hypothetical protein